MTQPVSIADAEALVALVAAAGDPTIDKSTAARKLEVVAGLRRLVDADAWVWTTGTFNPDRAGDSMAVSMLDDGWRSPAERVAFLETSTNPAHTAVVFPKLSAALAAGTVLTMTRADVMDDAAWAASAVGRDWRATGMDHFVISAYPLGCGGYSAIGLHRRVGKPGFTERDRVIVHLLWRNLDWLHREGGTVPAADKVIDLSPRERQVVLLLIGGDGKKEVAAKLRLSEHTVGDYVKTIYRKFDVSSRGELLAQFIGPR